jgi:hypothetical protein
LKQIRKVRILSGSIHTCPLLSVSVRACLRPNPGLFFTRPPDDIPANQTAKKFIILKKCSFY